MRACTCLIVITTTCTTAYSSTGDRLDVFQRCLDKCVRQSCTAIDNDGCRGRNSNYTSAGNPLRAQQTLPLALRLMRLDVRGRLQVHLHAHADGLLRWSAACGWSNSMASGRSGALRACMSLGHLLRRELAHARPRCGLAAPRGAPRAPNKAFLSHLGLCESQRVGLVRRVSHPWCVYSVYPPPPAPHSFFPTRIYIFFLFPHGNSFSIHLCKNRVFDLLIRVAPPLGASRFHTVTPLTEKSDYFSAPP
jgi:hypothetical protein